VPPRSKGRRPIPSELFKFSVQPSDYLTGGKASEPLSPTELFQRADRHLRRLFPEWKTMPVFCDQGEALSVIRLQGDVNICSAAEFKQILLRALARGKDVRVDLSSVTELDLSALQLLWAAEREAKGAGVEFSFAGQCQQDVAFALAAAGFEKSPLPTKPI